MVLQRGIFVTLLVAYLLSAVFVKAQETTFINKIAKVGRYAESQWFIDNIPFLEIPDKEIEEVYYYRWESLKRHLRYTHPGAGYVITEFVHAVGYSQKFDTINAAAGHHIDEARWLRNTRYVKDYINVWAREGAGNQQYSEWISDASYRAFLVNGDLDFIKSQQEGLVNNFEGWEDRFEPLLSLYFLSPHDDAMEHSASSEQTGDGYHGGLGYRPSFNSEMYANAMALASIARMNSDQVTAQLFEMRGAAIRQGILDHLWDEERKFFYHMFRENNTGNELLDSREEIGFFPWRFGVPDHRDRKYEEAWEQLFDPLGFDAKFGPTTCEQRSKWFVGNRTTFCWWSGDSWPYSTGMTLKSLAAQIKHYTTTDFANVDNFVNLLHKYAVTQYRDGKPYVAESHSSLYEIWLCDGFNHSEHYAHSTFTDNVLSDLIGIEPQDDNTLLLNPLVPSSWTYFVAENIRYHGHNITILYDSDGSRYETGEMGLQVFVNGKLAAVQAQVGPMWVDVPPPIIDNHFNANDRVENYASNVNAIGFPMPNASFTSIDASVWHAVDGRIIYDPVPSNRWTNFDSPNLIDWFSIDLGPGRVKAISQVTLYIFSDFVLGRGQVDCPTNVVVEYWTGTTWREAQNQLKTPQICVPNDTWKISFEPTKSEKIRLIFHRNESNGTYVGFTELEMWAPWPQAEKGVYEAEDGILGGASIYKSDSASGGSFVGGLGDPGASLEFTGVWADYDNIFYINIYYSNPDSTGVTTMNLTINNIGEYNQLVFPPTSTGWGEFDGNGFQQIQASLIRGSNVLIFKSGNRPIHLDKIVIV